MFGLSQSKSIRTTLQSILALVVVLMTVIVPGAAQAAPGRPTGVARMTPAPAPKNAGTPAPARIPGLAAEASVDAPAAETWQWMFGNWTEQKGMNCSILGQPYIETMTRASVGYEGTTPDSVPFHPFVGETYYGSIYMGVTGNPCGLGFDMIATRVVLPPNTVLAIDAQHPVRCWGLLASGGDWKELTNETWRNPSSGTTGPYCKTNPTQFGDGSWDFGFRLVGRGQQFQVLFPMRSLGELKGMAGPNGGDRMGAVVTSAVSTNYADYPSPAVPTQFVTVIPNPNQPAVSYPTPSASNITDTTARSTARLNNYFTGGNVIFDLGTTTEYGISTPPLSIPNTAESIPQLFADWSQLDAGTTYHWRMRFLAADGRVFTGADQMFTTTGDSTPPTIAISNVSKAEGHTGTSNAAFTLTLSRASTREIRVTYTTADGTAKAGQDYTATTNTAIIPAGTTTQTVMVPVLGDTLYEANETFAVNLTNPINVTIADAQGISVISNDDAAPSLTVADVRVTEGNSGAVNAIFTVKLSQASGLMAKVNYATGGGTATTGTDYVSRSGTLVIAAGTTTAQIIVPVRGDTLYEANETFNVNLSTPVGLTLADNLAVGVITNNDAAPRATIADVQVTEGHSGAVNAIFTVKLSQASGLMAKVNYATGGGTATVGTDYVSRSGTLVIAAGTTSAQIIVPVRGDRVREATETFNVTLSTPVGLTLADNLAVGTIANDD